MARYLRYSGLYGNQRLYAKPAPFNKKLCRTFGLPALEQDK